MSTEQQKYLVRPHLDDSNQALNPQPHYDIDYLDKVKSRKTMMLSELEELQSKVRF